jgi:carboxyl-terminal processing protease
MLRYVSFALGLLIAGGVAMAGPISEGPSEQYVVRQSASLLLTTFYRKLPPQQMLNSERDALQVYLRAHGAPNANLPSVPSDVDAKSAGDTAAREIDAAVATGKISADNAVAIGIKAMTSSAHDKYTTYFTKREYKAFDEVLDPTKLSGIGVLMDTDPSTKYLRAFFVVPDTPADRSGMKSGDNIKTIDGRSTHGFTVAQGRKYLLGKSGTQVHLTVSHAGDGDRDITLTRAEVQPPTVYFTMLPNDVAYVYVAAFGDATPKEFHTAVTRSENAGAKAYVLDLRNDGGGRVGTALAVSSQFMESGPIVSIESNGGEIDTFEADNTAIAPKPLAVLVNGYSASASEITAAALQESGTGVLVGTKTFGKGVVQSVTKFADGSAIKITTGRYYTPLHHDINGHGITPNVVVSENEHAIFGTPGKDQQLTRALEVLKSALAQRQDAIKPD